MVTDHPSDPGRERGDSNAEALENAIGNYVERLTEGESLDRLEILAENPGFGDKILQALHDFVDFNPQRDNTPLGTLGDYTLRRQIGRGGMGVVYEAWQHSVERSVALKVLPAGIAADERALQRFVREAKTAAQLVHPNVVGVHGMGLEKDTPYYAMEYVEGETLAQVLRKIKDSDDDTETVFGNKNRAGYFEKIARCFADVADGLQHAHSKGVVHRDIKPSNLILDREGRLRILDFGLARLEGQDTLTLSGDCIGTPAYMSPEQAKRRKILVDHRTDVYSLGATMYELLAGQQPFRGKDHAETLSQIIERDPRPPRLLNSRVPQDLETIVLKCLRKDSADRYGTAEALAQDLRRFVRGDPVEAAPESPWDRARRRLWRQRRLALGATLVLSALLIGSLIANVLIANARDQARRDLYVSNVRLAMEDWTAGNVRRFDELLEKHRPEPGEVDLRGWEWYYLRSLRDETVFKRDVDPEGVDAVAWSPDDRVLAVAGVGGGVTLWDASSKRRVREWTPGRGRMIELSWNPTGDGRFAAVFSERVVLVFEASDRSEPIELAGQSSLAWSPDGRLLAFVGPEGEDRTLVLWDTSTGELDAGRSWGVGNQILGNLSWSPDGRVLAGSGNYPGEIILWRRESWEDRRFRAHWNRVFSLSWSPDGKRLASAGFDQKLCLWDAATGALAERLDIRSTPFDVAWHPQKNLLAAGGDDGITRLWDLESAREAPQTLRGHEGRVTAVNWSRDGTLLATAGRDGTVRVWSVRPGALDEIPGGEAPAAWSPDGRLFASDRGDGSHVDVRAAETGTVIATLSSCAVSLAFSPPGGRLLAIATGARPNVSRKTRALENPDRAGDIDIWNWEDDTLVARLPSRDHGSRGLEWSPDGNLLAVPERDGRCVLWHVENETIVRALRISERLSSRKPRNPIKALRWSPSGTYFAATNIDQALVVWETKSWRVAFHAERGRAPHRATTWYDVLAWTRGPDGERLAAGSSSGQVLVWQAGTWEQTHTLLGHNGNVLSVAWNPDGTRLASGGQDRTVRIWDTRTGDELLTLDGHEFGVTSLRWHPDGKRLLSADEGLEPVDETSRSLRIWDARRAHASAE